MKVNEKIRLLREQKNWSQEEMANKLGMSTNGYSKIERGETRIYMSKLEEIAEIFDINILELISVGERNVILFSESENNHSVNIIGSSPELSAEITRMQEKLNHKDEIIERLKQEIETLKSVLDLLKQKG